MEDRLEKAEQLKIIPIKKEKVSNGNSYFGTKNHRHGSATIDKTYEDLKASKHVTEDSALVSLRYAARNMVETCDVLFENFPGLLSMYSAVT